MSLGVDRRLPMTGVMTLPIEIQGDRRRVIFDTGATHTVMFVSRKVYKEFEGVEKFMDGITGPSFPTKQAKVELCLVVPGKSEMMDITIEDARLVASDDVDKETSIIGMDVIRQVVLTVNGGILALGFNR